MPSVDPVRGATTPTAATQAQGSANAALGKDDFLKLFVAQLQHQDPLTPLKDAEFMGQMASFSTLEQVSKLAAANEQIAGQLSLNGSVSLIGRTVTHTAADGEPRTGVVERVATQDGKPVLTVGGVDGVDPSTITQVA